MRRHESAALAALILIASAVSGQSLMAQEKLHNAEGLYELYPESNTELELERERGLKVEVLEAADGVMQLRTSASFKLGDHAIYKVVADLETGTYTAKVIQISREAFELLGVFQPNENRIEAPPEKVRGFTGCGRVDVQNRTHTGDQQIFRGVTEAFAEWFYSDEHGRCLDLYDKGVTCTPAFGMHESSCHITGGDNGVSTAYLTARGSYKSLQMENNLLTVHTTTLINIDGVNFVAAGTSSVSWPPFDESAETYLFVSAYEVICRN